MLCALGPVSSQLLECCLDLVVLLGDVKVRKIGRVNKGPLQLKLLLSTAGTITDPTSIDTQDFKQRVIISLLTCFPSSISNKTVE
jgi:hypothetical protein